MHAHLTEPGFDLMMRAPSPDHVDSVRPSPAGPAWGYHSRSTQKLSQNIFAAVRQRCCTTSRAVLIHGHRAPPGLPRPRRQRRHQGRHRRLRRASPPTARAPPPACSPEPLRRTERDDQPPQRRRRLGAQAVVVISKNANVATGAAGRWPTPRSWPPASPPRLGCAPSDVLVASTGVIGRPLPDGPHPRRHLPRSPAPLAGDRRRRGGRGDHDHRHRRQGRRAHDRRRPAARSSASPRASA